MSVLEWQIATVRDIRTETAQVKSFTFALPRWMRHRAGQHYDLRLTAPDGYRAQRSYSIASAPEREGSIDLTIERVEDGEVSTFMHETVTTGDRIELRGPIGGYFVWDASAARMPLLLIAGGSGVVPMMSMLRHRAAAGARTPARLLFSSRGWNDVIYREELEALSKKRDGLDVFHTLTRSQPSGWTGFARRIDDAMLAEVSGPIAKDPLVFICGPTALVEGAASSLERIGIPAARIKTERFGPTGT
jgi:ferredoxin-NADP reductase